MGLSGQQKALMYALGGVARGGATRGGYHSALPYISFGGVFGSRVLIAGLTVHDLLDEAPNTCQFTMMGTPPALGADISITLGSQNGARLFGGKVISCVQGNLVQKPANVYYQVNGIDYTWLLGEHLVIRQYAYQTVEVIARDLIASFTEGLTANHIGSDIGPVVVDAISFTNTAVGDALSQLCSRVGAYWNIDYYKDLHLFTQETAATGGSDPVPLTPTHPSFTNLTTTQDLSQVATRVFVEGGGGTVLVAVDPGETLLPVDTIGWYQTGGGQVTVPPQRLTYTGVVAGGAGSVVGPGVTPTTGPGVTPKAGTGVDVGPHTWAYTWVTPSGETLPSPITAAATQSGAPPATALLATAPFLGATTPPTNGIAAPAAGVSISNAIRSTPGLEFGTYEYVVTFYNASGETTPSPISNAVTITDINYSIMTINLLPIGPDGTVGRRLYRRFNRTGAFGLVRDHNNNTETQTGDSLPNAQVGAPAPTTNTTGVYIEPGSYDYVVTFVTDIGETMPGPVSLAVTTDAAHNVIPLTNIPLGPPEVTARNVYRRKNGAYPLLQGTLQDNVTTSYNDGSPASALGAAAPSANTAIAQRFTVAVSVGPGATNARRLYRSVAGTTQLKLLTTLADNLTTSYLDALADAALGAPAPTTDTSGFQQPNGQVLIGSTTLLLNGMAPAFNPAGGWAIVGNGNLVVRYHGISGNSLTGIPVTGSGAITTSISYGAMATAAPMLVGIPANGAGSVIYPLHTGDGLQLLVTCDDVNAQHALQALIGGTGIKEAYIQDQRIGYAEALARGAAMLSERSAVLVEVRYSCRDLGTRSGATIAASLPAPTNLLGSYKIQEVTINGFSGVPGQAPTYTVLASSQRYSLDDLLRMARGTIGA
jgi:hypothetical protein